MFAMRRMKLAKNHKKKHNLFENDTHPATVAFVNYHFINSVQVQNHHHLLITAYRITAEVY